MCVMGISTGRPLPISYPARMFTRVPASRSGPRNRIQQGQVRVSQLLMVDTADISRTCGAELDGLADNFRGPLPTLRAQNWKENHRHRAEPSQATRADTGDLPGRWKSCESPSRASVVPKKHFAETRHCGIEPILRAANRFTAFDAEHSRYKRPVEAPPRISCLNALAPRASTPTSPRHDASSCAPTKLSVI